MLEYPKNYEEAKIIIKNGLYDDYTKRVERKNLLRAGLVTALGAGAVYGVNALASKGGTFMFTVPIALTASFVSFLPVIAAYRSKKMLKEGSYFSRLSEEETMQMARHHVDEYNAFEEQRKSRGR